MPTSELQLQVGACDIRQKRKYSLIGPTRCGAVHYRGNKINQYSVRYTSVNYKWMQKSPFTGPWVLTDVCPWARLYVPSIDNCSNVELVGLLQWCYIINEASWAWGQGRGPKFFFEADATMYEAEAEAIHVREHMSMKTKILAFRT